jgi:large subunit ribosomal protein L18
LLSRKPRCVVRKSNTKLIAQIVKYSPKGDIVIASADSSQLKKQDWNFAFKSIPAAYLTGLMLAKNALKKQVKEAILDIGLQRSKKGSRLYALLKGAVDGGLNIPCDVSIFPKQERLEGKHILTCFEKTKNNQFSKIKKQNTPIKDLSKQVETIKTKLLAK